DQSAVTQICSFGEEVRRGSRGRERAIKNCDGKLARASGVVHQRDRKVFASIAIEIANGVIRLIVPAVLLPRCGQAFLVRAIPLSSEAQRLLCLQPLIQSVARMVIAIRRMNRLFMSLTSRRLIYPSWFATNMPTNLPMDFYFFPAEKRGNLRQVQRKLTRNSAA